MNAAPPTSAAGSQGFTLVEVMMAMLIMTVGLFGLLQSVNVAYEHLARNKLREEAVQLAEEQLNGFRVRPFDQITARNAGAIFARPVAGAFRNFSVTRRSQAIPAGGSSKKLSVSVGWRFKNLKTEHVIYTMKNK
jgi:type IV pilus assembly protein PilV